MPTIFPASAGFEERLEQFRAIALRLSPHALDYIQRAEFASDCVSELWRWWARCAARGVPVDKYWRRQLKRIVADACSGKSAMNYKSRRCLMNMADIGQSTITPRAKNSESESRLDLLSTLATACFADPAQTAQARIDVALFRRLLNSREDKAVSLLLEGHTSRTCAKLLGMTAADFCRLRQRMARRWDVLQAS